MESFRPENFMLIPTMACQASCRYCFARKAGGIMSRETAEKALDLIARLAPAGKDFNLTFHGGEPLLAGTDFYAWIFPELISRFGRRVHLSIQSNLWALTDGTAELFRKFRVSVGVSLDGPEDMCDSQRGEGYYRRTTEKIGLLRSRGIAVGIICTAAAGNFQRTADVFTESRTPYSIHGAVPVLGSPENPLAVTPEQMTRILTDSYAAYKADPAHNRITTLDAMAAGCLKGEGTLCKFTDCLGHFAAIGPDGDVYSCQRFCGLPGFSFGDVRDDLNGAEIIRSNAYLRLREAQDEKRGACKDCGHAAYCGGGCLYNALTAGTVKDPCCPAYKTAFDLISRDMALEMGSLMLGHNDPVPVLAMAGDRKHPYDLRLSRERISLAVRKGLSPEPFAISRLRNPYPENGLNKLYLHLTFDCPLRCGHCYAEGGERKTAELDPERFAGIIREAADRCFASAVITGGEPLVYRGFDALCGMIKETDRKGMKLILRSSFGFPVQEERMRSICTLFDEIAVSVDGDRRTHDARRGTGRYDLTVRNLETAAAAGFAEKLSLAAVLSPADAEGAPGESVQELADRLGIWKVRFRPLLPLGRAAGTAEEPLQLCLGETDAADDFYLRHTCGLGQNLYVEPDGAAYPCYAWCGPEHRLGDLASESLGTLLDRGGLFEYCRHDVDTNEKCRHCEVRYLCGGICKARVRDRHNIDSGDFDCTEQKRFFLHMAGRIKGEANGTA